MKKLICILLLYATGALFGFASGPAETVCASAFANHKSNFQVSGGGQVIKILSDDTNGSRHQRFIITLASGQTLLIAHNIDIAKRIPALAVGDTVEFSGEYEWNPQGGVIHWTHLDPQSNHSAGWLKHKGQTYQ